MPEEINAQEKFVTGEMKNTENILHWFCQGLQMF